MSPEIPRPEQKSPEIKMPIPVVFTSETGAFNVGEIIESTVDAGRAAIDGIRGVILSGRLKRAENKLQDLDDHDHVIVSAPAVARKIRGFASEPDSPDVVPIGRIERATLHHREKQVKKTWRARRERSRIAQIYNEPVPYEMVEGLVPEIVPSPPGSVDADRWNKMAEKQAKQDRGVMAAFTETRRMPAPQRRTVRRRDRQFDALGKRIDRIDHRLDKGAAGETVPGRAREILLERREQKIETREQRLDTHEDAAAQRATERADRKAGRQDARARKRQARQDRREAARTTGIV